MIEFNCGKCGCFYKLMDNWSGKSVRCKKCNHVTTLPDAAWTTFGYYPDVQYEADGMTPNFDDLFRALAEEERLAPALAAC